MIRYKDTNTNWPHGLKNDRDDVFAEGHKTVNFNWTVSSWDVAPHSGAYAHFL